MKSMKAKVRNKKPNGKFGRVKFPPKNAVSAPINPDLSQLRKPINTSVSTLHQVTKLLETGSDEVKSILAYECDILYECRICRSLFRSLVNFISHKRGYCREKFDIAFAGSSAVTSEIILPEEPVAPEPEKTVQESCGNDRILRSQVAKEEPKKDLSAIVEMLQKKQEENLDGETDHVELYLEKIDSHPSVVYQTLNSGGSEDREVDLMKTQITELENMMERHTVILNSEQDNSNEGKSGPQADRVGEDDDPLKSDPLDEKHIVCPICNAKFATKKTLAVHARTLHTSHRLYYPCPCCSSTFANTWSVHRHLYKVHRKSNEQVRALRSQIQEKAFLKDTVASEEVEIPAARKTPDVKDPLAIDETQEWMDYLESDTELPRCGGCGKKFYRKAALSAHSQYCQRRIAAYSEATSKLRKPSNKALLTALSNVPVDVELEKEPAASNSPDPALVINENETSIRVEAVASLSKADWDMLNSEELILQANEASSAINSKPSRDRAQNGTKRLSPASDVSDPPEIIFTNINKSKAVVGSRKRKMKDNVKQISNGTDNSVRSVSPKPKNDREPEAGNTEHALLMEKKVAAITNLEKLQCLPCKRKFTSVTNLKRHVAIHIGWNRYRCKLCDFKCYVKCDCVAHCNMMHNAQNNRTVITDMIAQIPSEEYARDQETIVMDITNTEVKTDPPEVVEVSPSPERPASITPVEDPVQVIDEPVQEARANGEPEAPDSKDENASRVPKLDADPDLRRMVMEVIFGSSDEHAQADARPDSGGKTQNSASATGRSGKEGDSIFVQDASKPQRPIRNRIKPLNKDFIYDLKEVPVRKDVLVKSCNKAPAKKSSSQSEECVVEEEHEEQSLKRVKSLHVDGITLLDEGEPDKLNVKLTRENLKNSFSLSQCGS